MGIEIGNGSNYQYILLTKSQSADDQLVTSLCRFYNQALVAENTDSVLLPDEFRRTILQDTLDTTGGRIVFATDQSGEVCGFIAGYNTDFSQVTFQLHEGVPEGKYYYTFGLGNTTGELRVISGLVSHLLDGVVADFCVGLVSHSAPIYQRKIYQRRGWVEVASDLPIAQERSYFYIPRGEVIN